MKPDKESPQKVFFQPARLVVPLFQRPYVWSRELQWEPLWQDIERLTELLARDSTSTHFLGAFVVQQLPTDLGHMPAWSVIDGQQRLTTLQVLLDALHAELLSRDEISLAGQVEPLIQNPPAFHIGEHDRYKVWPTNHDRVGFVSIMSAGTPVDYASVVPSRLAEAHEYFASAIRSWLDSSPNPRASAHLLVTAVTSQLELVSIRLDANEDAQAIFETLNARGVPLSAADLIKNYVFQNFKGTDAETESAYYKYWAELETPWWVELITSGRVTHPRSSWFLWHWLRGRKLEDFPIRELFGQFKSYVSSRDRDLLELLPEIKSAADRYRVVIEGAQKQDGPLSREQWFSYRVGTLDSEVIRPLLIWLDEEAQADIPDGDRLSILRSLESWFVRRAIVKAPSQGVNKFLMDLLVRLSKKPHDELAIETENYLASNNTPVGYWPDDDEVTSALEGAPAFNKYLRARLRMILEALEDYRRGYPDWRAMGMGPVPRRIGTIEHLMPRKWRVNWETTWADEEMGAKSASRDRVIHELGNLTLVTNKLNSRVSHSAWKSKVAHFREANDVLITNDVIQSAPEEWNESLISSRTKTLTETILKIWPVPEGHVSAPGVDDEPARVGAVDLALLVSEGAIAQGAELVARPAVLKGARAAIGLDGRIYVNGHGHDTPSAAGVAANSDGLYKGGINGWRFWKIRDSGKTLWEIRNEFRLSLGEETGGDDVGEDTLSSEQIEAELSAAEEIEDGGED
ncbi:DUF262 domain-containing protein [Yonghaparkia sp. Soil809]|uniref:GmrSD restriction endonuclease domain-containing protein n=1 Tax=Yonghaparkia sp. Soil809 TaxID=1736417 RepID=UPI0006FB9CC0|nr:DUF262 domain-containing protein [Yonghaparkia sp. Soil809]KRF31104.1 hypothetical protein ASG83_09795 [Yonghaparkia sp. Soil809]